jgi:hypothetical protein
MAGVLLLALLLYTSLSLSFQRAEAETVIAADTAIDTSVRWSLAVGTSRSETGGKARNDRGKGEYA